MSTLALLAIAVAMLAVDVQTCTLVKLTPPKEGAIALTFPPVEMVQAKDGSMVTVFRQPGTIVLYWLWVEEGQIKWTQETITVKQTNGPTPPPKPDPEPQPNPNPGPIPTNISVIWLEESSKRTPAYAKLQVALREELEKANVSFGVVDADNPVSFIQALVKELKSQITNFDLNRGPLLVILKPQSSQVIAATYVDERNTVTQLLDWIKGRSPTDVKNDQVGSSRPTGVYRPGHAAGRTTQPVFCPIPGACPISP